MGEMIILIIAIAITLYIGDRLGSVFAARLARKRNGHQASELPCWLNAAISLLIPTLVLAGLFGPYALSHDRNAFEHMVDNMESLLIAAFFITGVVGGFMSGLRK